MNKIDGAGQVLELPCRQLSSYDWFEGISEYLSKVSCQLLSRKSIKYIKISIDIWWELIWRYFWA